ncbi:MAG: alanine racemase [Candidatus Cloacimonadaceae bacterium]|jgi:alanine racemase|nr:alanine racemase [Candidatus Cloacimonadota bacterium]MDY0127710.1 alanine racemase [Candidatus Cloacimonadaceae bacterium]MCB5254897.1 alanine racemase [Candidatus Cloacimonadota bacterium]MCK9177757.1 alanine racemase [Candidatus Cloacimonadota bacterium]MCK9242232.1 alanine racemase [Candidatus Cloacimonadota bacterium]
MKIAIEERSWVEIDLTAFQDNLQLLKGYLRPGQSFMQIVKADAYGHGAKEIAEIAIAQGAAYLGVANLEEGKLLRIQGIQAPILILSPSLSTEIKQIIHYDLSLGVADLDFATVLAKAAVKANKTIKIHLNLDTGMHRSGICFEEAMALYDEVSALPGLEIEGVFSHFASAENDSDFSRLQESRFAEFVQALEAAPRFVHLSNSAGLIHGYAAFCNLVRLGISSFGVKTTDEELGLKPVMTFKSTLSQIKEFKAGDSVGYQRQWIAKTSGRYGIVPVGYADGYDFLLSNKAMVLINGCMCPVIGRVSMDMITVDISQIPEARISDEVVLLGKGDEALRAEHIASLYQGSAYELLCQVGRRARRYYRDKAHILHSSPLARRDFVSSDFGDSKLSQIISSALAQRLDSPEIGELIYREILRTFFYNKDRDVHYRKNFRHEIRFDKSDAPAYYRAETTLRYKKVLNADHFVIACAASSDILQGYILRTDVEYRWLLDSDKQFKAENFQLNAVKVNGIDLKTKIKSGDGYLEILCSHPKLQKLINREVEFEINTNTLYPTTSHQFSVFITELTRGVEISFSYPQQLSHVEAVTVFSGQQKNPPIQRADHRIMLKTSEDEWVFPISGVVFCY